MYYVLSVFISAIETYINQKKLDIYLTVLLSDTTPFVVDFKIENFMFSALLNIALNTTSRYWKVLIITAYLLSYTYQRSL